MQKTTNIPQSISKGFFRRIFTFYNSAGKGRRKSDASSFVTFIFASIAFLLLGAALPLSAQSISSLSEVEKDTLRKTIFATCKSKVANFPPKYIETACDCYVDKVLERCEKYPTLEVCFTDSPELQMFLYLLNYDCLGVEPKLQEIFYSKALESFIVEECKTKLNKNGFPVPDRVADTLCKCFSLKQEEKFRLSVPEFNKFMANFRADIPVVLDSCINTIDDPSIVKYTDELKLYFVNECVQRSKKREATLEFELNGFCNCYYEAVKDKYKNYKDYLKIVNDGSFAEKIEKISEKCRKANKK